jgi:hypothetical protein
MMAWLNSLFEPGMARCWQTLNPPADSPKMVTLSGSPPKALGGERGGGERVRRRESKEERE